MDYNQNQNAPDGLKYLKALSEIASRLKCSIPLEQLCGEICQKISSLMRFSDKAVVRVQVGKISRMSPDFHTSPWGLSRDFQIVNKNDGRLEVYYTSEEAWPEGLPFIKEEEDLLDNIAGLLSGAAIKAAFEKLLYDNTERQKELGGITRIISILKENRPIQILLTDICQELPGAWQYPDYTGARIFYGDLVFSTNNFSETQWMMRQSFKVPEGPCGAIEICYTKQFPPSDEGPFLKEERNLINNLSQLLAAAAGSRMYESLVSQNKERLKELNAINQTTQIITHGYSIANTLQNVCSIIPQSMQFPEYTAARITYAGKEYVSAPFKETPWTLREQLITIDNLIGTIEVFYLKEFPSFDEGPFLKEERNLLRNIARLLAHFLNNYKGRQLLERSKNAPEKPIADRLYSPASNPHHQNNNELSVDVPQGTSLPHTIREVLLITTPYEAFVIQTEGSSFAKADSLHSNGLWYPPKITIVNTAEQAFTALSRSSFDMVFIMAGLESKKALETYNHLSTAFPILPVYLLISRSEHLHNLQNIAPSALTGHKQTFLWNNDISLLYAIVKLHEDMQNAAFSSAPVVLLVEDNPEILSKIITRLYYEFFLRPELNSSQHNDNGSLPSRPHLFTAGNYEAAIHILRQYQNRLCCVLSDVEFEKSGTLNNQAGIDLIRVIQEQNYHIPCLLHSSEKSHQAEALETGVCFLDKQLPGLLEKMVSFVKIHLQETYFVLLDPSGKTVGQANDLNQIFQLITTSSSALIADNIHSGYFSKWLFAHGEEASAKEILTFEKSDMEESVKVRKVAQIFRHILCKKHRGSAVQFENVSFFDESFVNVLCGGSYGGKGRSVAFLNSFVNNLPTGLPFSGLNIRTPCTAIIGTDEFDQTLKQKSVLDANIYDTDFETVRNAFIKATLSGKVKSRLRSFIAQSNVPIAVRSSSLFEDSLTQPFAGAFETYIIPNSDPDIDTRLEQIELAIKLVFASLFRPEARTYFTISGRDVREEKMAIVIQEIVGTSFDSCFFPHISGVAGSYNYYPVGHMRTEEGFAVIAYGLGVYVVEGRSGHRFSPAYPSIYFGSIKDSLDNSQVRFYAVNTSKTKIDMVNDGEKAGLLLLDIDNAEKLNALNHCASVYDSENDRVEPDLQLQGPRIMDFADILKFDYIPLANTLKIVLSSLEERMGTQVEIEFAVTLPHANNNHSLPALYLLQTKPLVGEELVHNIRDSAVAGENVILYSETALGNGIIDTITDVIMVDLQKFDRLKTEDIAREVEYFNRKLQKENKFYALIGPGRWGTRDKSLGIPVNWAQICNARVIIELGISNYPLDASQGSHFFHNLTAMKVGYMAVEESKKTEFIRLDAFSKAIPVESQNYIKHIRFSSPLIIEIDGQRRKSFVLLKD